MGIVLVSLRMLLVLLLNFACDHVLLWFAIINYHGNHTIAMTMISVVTGRPYDGKASDMWALGVLLYTTLYGQFPFYDSDPQELFRKIKAADYVIPE